VYEDAGARDGGCLCGEVGCFGEPFVAEGEDFGAEGGGDEVWEALDGVGCLGEEGRVYRCIWT
jgi:hypothetical protein